MTQEALKLALEALEEHHYGVAQIIIREALAQTQEPLIGCVNHDCDKCQAQRTWVGLTDEEIKPCWHEACQTDLELTSQLVVYFARAIEAKLKEKNNGV